MTDLILSLLFRCGVAGGAGYAIMFLWRLSGLEHAATWGRFYAIALPLCYVMFSASYLLLSRPKDGQAADAQIQAVFARFFRYDDHTYLVLLGFLGLELASSIVEYVSFWLAAAYLAIIVFKTALWLACLHDYVGIVAAQPPSRERLKRLHRLLLVTAFAVYALISGYHQYRMTTTGDEPHYLLITHSIWHDHDTNLLNNYQQKDYASFFWEELRPTWGDQISATEIYSYRHKGGFPVALLPGYVLGGRLGATLEMNLIAALLLGQVFLLSYELFHSLPASLMTWGSMAFTIPFVVYMGQIYPETLAGLLAVWIIRQIRALPAESVWRNRRFWTGGIVIGLSLFLLVLLKTRYLPLAGTLMLFFFAHLLQRSARLSHKLTLTAIVGGLLAVLIVAVLLADTYLLDRMLQDRLTDSRYMSWMLAGYNPFNGAIGLLLDQEYGLIFYTPLYLLALVGIGLLSRQELRQTAPLLAVAALNHLSIALWPLWHAAPTPPARYLLPFTPLFGVFIAKFWEQPEKCVTRVSFGVFALWSAAAAWITTFNPWWRYNWADGTNNFLEAMLSSTLAINFNRFFPSFIRPSHNAAISTLLAAFVVGLLIAILRRGRREQASPCSIEAAIMLTLLIGSAMLCGGLLAAKRLPTAVIEAEDALEIEARDGERVPPTYDPWYNQTYLRDWGAFGWKLEAGQAMTLRPKLLRWFPRSRAGVTPEWTMIVYARKEGKKKGSQDAPALQLLLGEEKIGKIRVESTAWQAYVVPVRTAEARPALTLKAQAAAQSEHAVIIDKILFR